jgi:hypothetical protein
VCVSVEGKRLGKSGFMKKFPENRDLAEKIYIWMNKQSFVDLETFMRTGTYIY